MNKNSGFSLIELLVTIAVSGLVILMISFIMLQGTTLFKGENEVIDIQSEIQIIRNQLTETLMSAKEITVVKADKDIVIYTGDVDESNNRLVAETSGVDGKSGVTTERIITYVDGKDSVYISSNLGTSESLGSLISNYVTSMDIVVNEGCKKIDDSGKEYYTNPLSIDIKLRLVQGEQSADVNVSVKVRNILTELTFYTASSRTQLLGSIVNEQNVRKYKVK